MKLRSRKNLQKVGISQHTAEGYVDGDFVELSAFEQENDITFDYTAGSKRKIRQKSRDGVEEPEPQQQDVQNDKSQVSSCRKKVSKDAPTEKKKNTEKKLTHRIRSEENERLELKITKHQGDSIAMFQALIETLPGPSSNTRMLHVADNHGYCTFDVGYVNGRSKLLSTLDNMK